MAECTTIPYCCDVNDTIDLFAIVAGDWVRAGSYVSLAIVILLPLGYITSLAFILPLVHTLGYYGRLRARWVVACSVPMGIMAAICYAGYGESFGSINWRSISWYRLLGIYAVTGLYGAITGAWFCCLSGLYKKETASPKNWSSLEFVASSLMQLRLYQR